MKLSDMKLFSGETETITVSDLRSRPGDILQQAQMGKIFCVTKNGKPIVEIKEPEEPFDWRALSWLRKLPDA